MLMKYRIAFRMHSRPTGIFTGKSHSLELPARTNPIIIDNFQFFLHVQFSISRYSNCDKNRWNTKEMLETKQNKTKKHSKYFLSSRFRFGLTENFSITWRKDRPHAAWRDQLPWLALMFSARWFIKCEFGNSDGKLSENIDQRAEMRADK